MGKDIEFYVGDIESPSGRKTLTKIFCSVTKDREDYTEEYANLWDMRINEGLITLYASPDESVATVVQKEEQRANFYESRKDSLNSIRTGRIFKFEENKDYEVKFQSENNTSNGMSRLAYERDYTISWMEASRSHGAFDGFEEENIDFNGLKDEDLQFYFDEWIPNEEKDEIYSGQLEELKNAIEGYTMNEYGEGLDLDEIQHEDKIPVAYTTLGDEEEFEIQVTLNITEKRLESLVTASEIEEVEYHHYDHIWEITKEFQNVTFEDLIALDELDVNEMLNKNRYISELSSEKNEPTKNTGKTINRRKEIER